MKTEKITAQEIIDSAFSQDNYKKLPKNEVLRRLLEEIAFRMSY